MSLEIIQELDSTLSKYLLDNFSISIANPVTMVIFSATYLFMVLMALMVINIMTKDTYSNAMRAKIVSTDEGNDYVDFRRDVLNPSFAAAQEHGNLAGLGDDDHTQYLLIDGTRAMSGNLDLGANGIVGSGDIDIKPSGDVDDYLKFLTTSGQPIIKAIGGAGLQIESDHATAAVLKLFRSVGKQLTFGQTDADGAYIIGTETLDLSLGKDFDDY
ncbi:hypothetical protein LCGC14_1735440, partial [marine sediment metagenome]